MARSRPSGGSSFRRLGLVRGFASEYAPHRGCWTTTASGAADGRTARRPSTKAGRNRRKANEIPPGGQDPKFERRVVRLLLDSDPSIPWQVMRDLAEGPDELIAAERMTGMRARAVAGFASVRGGFYPPGSTFWPMPPPSVPQYHHRQTLGRESGDGRTGKGEHGARTGRIAGHPQQGDDPGLPAHRAPAVRKGHYRHEARDIERSRGCRNCSHGMNRRTDRATTDETGAAARSE